VLQWLAMPFVASAAARASAQLGRGQGAALHEPTRAERWGPGGGAPSLPQSSIPATMARSTGTTIAPTPPSAMRRSPNGVLRLQMRELRPGGGA
jgi:hypothetical protein